MAVIDLKAIIQAERQVSDAETQINNQLTAIQGTWRASSPTRR